MPDFLGHPILTGPGERFSAAAPRLGDLPGRVPWRARRMLSPGRGLFAAFELGLVDGRRSCVRSRRVTSMVEATITVADSKTLLGIFGTRDQHLRRIREALGVRITVRDELVRINGSAEGVAQAAEVIDQLQALAHRHAGALTPAQVGKIISQVTGADEALDVAPIQVGGSSVRQVEPKSVGQAEMIRAIREHDLSFAIGPAGSGKTYLAVAMAVAALRQEEVRKMVLVRPAVEAGESLGFLPGDLQAKIHPYLRPLLDALREMLDYDQIKRYTDQDLIEMIPLAYMRGRTLNNAFIILDEAQNTTVAQMKMFLTRMGRGSKVVVAGDTTQIDLAHNTRSGLIDALERLRDVEGVAAVELTKADIVRHRLVQKIVLAYEEDKHRRR